jgi:putative phage-type endonuclease
VNAERVVGLDPGSEAWLREMTASKVPAVLGLSPWESRFSLWYRMAGLVPAQDETAAMARGNYLEDAVARWVADQHRLVICEGLTWRNKARPWQVASPDRRVLDMSRPIGQGTVAVVEVKTAADWEPWGRDGTDEVPVYYRAQAVWQCDTLGVDTAFMGVLLPRLELRSYVVHPAPGEAEFIREECRAFMDSLAAGQPPDLDHHKETYATLRSLHPRIGGGEVEVSEAQAAAFASALLCLRAAEDNWNLERSRMAQVMGDAKSAAVEGRVIANRQPAPKTGEPYVAATRSKRLLAEFAALHPTTTEETDDRD